MKTKNDKLNNVASNQIGKGSVLTFNDEYYIRQIISDLHVEHFHTKASLLEKLLQNSTRIE